MEPALTTTPNEGQQQDQQEPISEEPKAPVPETELKNTDQAMNETEEPKHENDKTTEREEVDAGALGGDYHGGEVVEDTEDTVEF